MKPFPVLFVATLVMLCAGSALAQSGPGPDASSEPTFRARGYPPGRMGEGLYLADQRRLRRDGFQSASARPHGFPVWYVSAPRLAKGVVAGLQDEIRDVRQAARAEGRRLAPTERAEIRAIETRIRAARSNPVAAVTAQNVQQLLQQVERTCGCEARPDAKLAAHLASVAG